MRSSALKSLSRQLPIAAALASVLGAFGPSAANAGERVVDFAGTTSGTFVSSIFKFNTSSRSLLSTGSGKNNIGGQFSTQRVNK